MENMQKPNVLSHYDASVWSFYSAPARKPPPSRTMQGRLERLGHLRFFRKWSVKSRKLVWVLSPSYMAGGKVL